MNTIDVFNKIILSFKNHNEKFYDISKKLILINNILTSVFYVLEIYLWVKFINIIANFLDINMSTMIIPVVSSILILLIIAAVFYLISISLTYIPYYFPEVKDNIGSYMLVIFIDGLLIFLSLKLGYPYFLILLIAEFCRIYTFYTRYKKIKDHNNFSFK